MNVTDRHRSEAPTSAATTAATVDNCKLQEDCRTAVEEVAVEIGISYGIAGNIFTKDLNKVKKAAKWVLHVMNISHRYR